MLTSKRNFIVNFLEIVREKLEAKLSPEPRFEYEYHEEAMKVIKEEVIK